MSLVQCVRRLVPLGTAGSIHRAPTQGLVLVLLGALVLLDARNARSQDVLTATPYRPTVSNPADLSAPGHLEVEAGVLATSGGDTERRRSLPLLAKYAFSPDLGVLAGFEAGIHQTELEGSRLAGGGDSTLLIKGRHSLGSALALGVEAGAKLPTAKHGLGSGEPDYIVTAIASLYGEGRQLDLNLGYTRLGDSEEGQGRNGLSWAAALGQQLSDPWSVSVELSGTYRRGTDNSVQALAALGYSLSKTVILDAGFAVGLASGAPDRSVFLGMTVLFH